MRPIWRGGISFGLIYIPVKLYSASQDISIDLDLLTKDEHDPIRYARINTHTGKEVPWKDVVKGYEHEEGEYVVLDNKDFDKVATEKSETIDIVSFIDVDEIDPDLYDKPYYLEPDKGAKKTYALLLDAMKKKNKAGVAEFILRNRENLTLLRADKDILMLNRLRYTNEIRPSDDLDLPGKQEFAQKEVDMASKLIDEMTEKFDPATFKDDYIKELHKIIEAKAKNRKYLAKEKAEKPEPTEISQIIDQLEKSIKEIEVQKK